MFSRVKHILFALSLGMLLITMMWLAMSGVTAPDSLAARLTPNLNFVDDIGTPLAGAEMRILCYDTPTSGAPVADLMVTTGPNGEPLSSLPANCDYVAALHLRHEQPSDKSGHGPAYWVYATSWEPGTITPLTATGNITIRENWSIVLFNVVASLEWRPAPGSPFVADLRQGLHQASAYLYDLTEGQMAFGPVTIHTAGHNWDGADLRFRAANDLRPSAYVGGIVAERTPYTSTSLKETVYVPNTVFLGRYWDGLDASDPISGTWSQPDAYHTLVHEWAHYALFLYDEYQDVTQSYAETYCACRDLPDVGVQPGACGGVSPDLAASAMAYHYTASEFWQTEAITEEQQKLCEATQQWQVHGLSDWQTLAIWPEIQELPGGLSALVSPTTLNPDPELGLTGDLFGRKPGYRLYLPAVQRGGPAPSPISEPIIGISVTASPQPTETLPMQVYVLEGMASGTPARILHQGRAIGQPDTSGLLGKIILLGIDLQDRARVHVDRYTTASISGGRFLFPNPAMPAVDPVLSDGLMPQAIADTWQASLDATYALSGSNLTTMTLILTTPIGVGNEATAQLCVPEAAIGCNPGWRKTMASVPGTVTWTATFTPLMGTAELPRYGVIQIQAPDIGELIRWFQDSGGVGPAHEDGHAPLRDGHVMVDTNAPLKSPAECNRVIVMPAANYEALTRSLGQDLDGKEIQGIISGPWDIDILLPENGACPSLVPGDHTLPVSVTLTLFYNQEIVDQLGISQKNLRLLHYNNIPEHGFWEVVGIAGGSPTLNWLATVPVNEDGIYAIGWVKP